MMSDKSIERESFLPMTDRGPRYSGNLTQQVVSRISALIQSGALAVGEKLPSESEIVRREGVSRTVVREAISRLQAAGLVSTRHGIGTFVCEPAEPGDFGLDGSTGSTAGDVLALLEVRLAIESEVAALAAVRRTEAHLKDLTFAMESFSQEINTGRNAVNPDFQFHLGMAKAAGNRYFLDILTTLGSKVIPRARLKIDEQDPQRQEYLKRINNEHEDIYNAILRRDPEAARAAVRNHLINSRERMRRNSEMNKVVEQRVDGDGALQEWR
jgi:GntR family transcriptional repressor for pyruvate dehydrogenase complex